MRCRYPGGVARTTQASRCQGDPRRSRGRRSNWHRRCGPGSSIVIYGTLLRARRETRVARLRGAGPPLGRLAAAQAEHRDRRLAGVAMVSDGIRARGDARAVSGVAPSCASLSLCPERAPQDPCLSLRPARQGGPLLQVVLIDDLNAVRSGDCTQGAISGAYGVLGRVARLDVCELPRAAGRRGQIVVTDEAERRCSTSRIYEPDPRLRFV